MHCRLLRWAASRGGRRKMVNDNLLFVGAAFGVTWLVMIGYLVHLHRTTKRARVMLEMATKGTLR